MPEFTTGYTFGFSAVVCVLCSLGVASTAMGLQERQETNARRDLQENILSALGLPEDDRPLAGPEIDDLYASRVKVIVIDAEGSVLPDKQFEDVRVEAAEAKEQGRSPALRAVYQRTDGESVGAYALPMTGTGLWGPISGYLAIAPDGKTVSGVTFFAPKETPGLGYEIVNPPFTGQWLGKKIYDTSEKAPRPVRVVKGTVASVCGDSPEFCVQGVSGATMTSRGVDEMVARAIDAYNPYLEDVRSGGER